MEEIDMGSLLMFLGSIWLFGFMTAVFLYDHDPVTALIGVVLIGLAGFFVGGMYTEARAATRQTHGRYRSHRDGSHPGSYGNDFLYGSGGDGGG